MVGFKEFINLETLEVVLVPEDFVTFELLREGKGVSGRFDDNIQIDQPTHGVGCSHAHV